MTRSEIWTLAGRATAGWKFANEHSEDGCHEAVAEAITAAVDAERETCAIVAQDYAWSTPMLESAEENELTDDMLVQLQTEIAAAIRARGEKGNG